MSPTSLYSSQTRSKNGPWKSCGTRVDRLPGPNVRSIRIPILWSQPWSLAQLRGGVRRPPKESQRSGRYRLDCPRSLGSVTHLAPPVAERAASREQVYDPPSLAARPITMPERRTPNGARHWPCLNLEACSARRSACGHLINPRRRDLAMVVRLGGRRSKVTTTVERGPMAPPCH
jgi:hypothetical protein